MNNLRQYCKSGIRKALLTEERIKALNSIGMQWEVLDYLFERNYLVYPAQLKQLEAA